MDISFFQSKLLQWYQDHGRHDLPWQGQSPYHIWLSEVMLQQTQVSTVIPYYHRFIAHFPDIEALALAPEDKVFALWAGLGYYHRARNLRRSAQIIQEDHLGQFPSDMKTLLSLPGIGPSTAAAIAAQAFNLPEAIFDGNVKRVLARYFGIEGAINDKSVEQKLLSLAKACMPKTKCRDYTQAIMDMGATRCKPKKINCDNCPLTSHCQAFILKKTEEIPGKAKRPNRKQVFYPFLLLQKKAQIFLIKRPAKGIWPNLWCLPHLESPPRKTPNFENYHNLTHQRMVIQIFKASENDTNGLEGEWMTQAQIRELALPKPMKDFLAQLFSSS